MGFAVAFPRGGSSNTVSRSNWNLVVLVFDIMYSVIYIGERCFTCNASVLRAQESTFSVVVVVVFLIFF